MAYKYNEAVDFEVKEAKDKIRRQAKPGDTIAFSMRKKSLSIKKVKTIKTKPLSKIDKTKSSEANIAAEFYHQCKLQKINAYMEYTHQNCKFDCIIYDNQDNITHIIEFKKIYKEVSPIYKKLDENKFLKQKEKYEQYGIPLLFVIGHHKIKPVIKLIKNSIPE